MRVLMLQEVANLDICLPLYLISNKMPCFFEFGQQCVNIEFIYRAKLHFYLLGLVFHATFAVC